ncbi:hypothetical protein B0H19DRAFT_1251063 [Mycena capillaripes]|nr:hypothetical protein B0H19DRAFT_1251063 [Mycena capillaripes]
MSLDYTQIPVLDWTLAKKDKALFLSQLRGAMINVGFLYLSNHPVPMDIVDQVIDQTTRFFALPQEVKDSVNLTHSPRFYGYLQEGKPEYLKLQGNTLWLADEVLPGFRQTMVDYYTHIEDLSYEFTAYVGEALGLGAHELLALFGENNCSKLQSRIKVLRYPASPTAGFAPHADQCILTYLLQASEEPGLEVQNHSGDWVAIPPVPGTLVINLGKALEKVTKKVATATVHRVVPPAKNPWYSLAYFSSPSMDVRMADMKFEFPQEVLDMKKARDERTGDTTEFKLLENDHRLVGEILLERRLKRYPAATAHYYPGFSPVA